MNIRIYTLILFASLVGCANTEFGASQEPSVLTEKSEASSADCQPLLVDDPLAVADVDLLSDGQVGQRIISIVKNNIAKLQAELENSLIRCPQESKMIRDFLGVQLHLLGKLEGDSGFLQFSIQAARNHPRSVSN